ncbi:hypothetical protein FM106_04035 [Brachybacterium faecium]|nr:hypothetical protein FM106_04035 [Brachybacterium faecium]
MCFSLRLRFRGKKTLKTCCEIASKKSPRNILGLRIEDNQQTRTNVLDWFFFFLYFKEFTNR